MKCFILLLLIGACAAAAIEDDTKALEALMQAIDSNELDGVLENMRKNGVSTRFWGGHSCVCHHHVERDEDNSDDAEPMPASMKIKKSRVSRGWWGNDHNCHCGHH
ncbi:uncharacterized protein LOC119734471 [Patiria miniata]|uniref:Uncharacterized protein n=1 Tax=Patiria miniata TaxID=46514 RepID=A0A914AK34_PATMI|nr:uncharacterized protein LOC119734471 [Patiria miniata]XP_038063926.1 uncharacterized protein LOC119734471 [Patiria miniata]